jgi:uncharacterized membrane protein
MVKNKNTSKMKNNKRQLNTKLETLSNVKTEKNLSIYQRWRTRAIVKIEERLKHESKKIIFFKFFAAPMIALIGILFLFMTLNYSDFQLVGGFMIAYFFPPLGKESVIPLGIAAGLDPILIALSIAFVDMFIALFLVWNYDFAKLIPFMGPWMEKVEKTGGKKFTEKPWLENLAFFGLVLFVMFPFQGSGGVATSIIGRVIGMSKLKVFLAICIGAVVGCLLIAYFGYIFIGYFKNNIYQGLAVLIAIAIILTVYVAFKYLKKDNNNQK